MINSIEELPTVEVEGASLQYPVIDLDSHTLVIARWIYGGGSTLISYNLVVDQGVPTMNMVMGKKGKSEFENATAEVGSRYFWNIYPKIETDIILTNITNQ